MTAAPTITEEDYSELQRFIALTPRGQGFLAEHERRAQKLAAEEVIRLVTELRESWQQSAQAANTVTQVEVLRRELMDMSASIVQARREIAALRPQAGDGNDRIVTATNELDAIVQSTERASFEILTAAERMMDLTTRLRNGGSPELLCHSLEDEITNIFTACSFQDLTGQRTTKVVNALRYIEQRVTAMISIWDSDGALRPLGTEPAADRRPDAHLLNGPSDDGVDQDEIDRLLNGTSSPAARSEAPTPAPAPAPPKKAAAPNRPAPSHAAVSVPEPEPESGPSLGQNDIDSLFP